MEKFSAGNRESGPWPSLIIASKAQNWSVFLCWASRRIRPIRSNRGSLLTSTVSRSHRRRVAAKRIHSSPQHAGGRRAGCFDGLSYAGSEDDRFHSPPGASVPLAARVSWYEQSPLLRVLEISFLFSVYYWFR